MAMMPSAERGLVENPPATDSAWEQPVAGERRRLIYLDPRPFTRVCIGKWLQSSLSDASVYALSDPDGIETPPEVDGPIQAVITNTGPARMTSAAVGRLLARLSEILPGVPVAVLSDYEDLDNIREAFDLGVRGYIPTSLASMVAVGAVKLICLGFTFAPAGALLSNAERQRQDSAGEPLLEGFTHRQTQILDCLRRGMPNKLIAYELSMRESTVKVHVRNIMKKLKATNRTQVAYLLRGSFERPQRAWPTRNARVAGRSIP